MDNLQFDESNYEVKTYTIDQLSVTCRAYEGIPYCTAPVAAVQVMNIYVPEAYYQDAKINGYDLHTAPIFMPNTVGGYMEGPADMPGRDRSGHANSVFRALEHGYVVACAGIRGRTTGRKNTEFFEGSTGRISEVDNGRMVGKAPALIVDMKAAIRYLRYNKDRIPGDTERMITNGTSAGGALSALAGATGNSTDYEPYLKAIGAAEERDNIFAASCYCPIHNLENADAAYEWLFCGCNDFYRTMHKKTEHGIERVPFTGTMTEKQIAMSAELKKLFPAYVNSLHLTDMRKRSCVDVQNLETIQESEVLQKSDVAQESVAAQPVATVGDDGSNCLTLQKDGSGSFQDYVKSYVIQSAQKELDDHITQNQLPWLQVEGSRIEQQDYLVIENGKVVNLDWDAFVKKITRMKATPAFDAVDLNSPENEEFGTEEVEKKHFTAYSAAHSEVGGELADAKIIQMLNPTKYIHAGKAAAHMAGQETAKPDSMVGVSAKVSGTPDIAPHWRIRHGAFDRDTSLAIPVILATLLQNNGYDVDFMLPWGLPHSGDYDLDELFAWIDELCA